MISVCLATFNGEKYINQQISSILAQLATDDELIISDDNSTDRTKEIVLSFRDDRIKFHINNEDRGYTRNFENSIKKAAGDIIILSDQDDIWNENKVRYILVKLEIYDFVVSDCSLIDENGKDILDSYYQIRKPRKTFWGNIVKFGYLGCCMGFRRKILTRVLPFPTRRDLCTHDNWIFLIAILFYKCNISKEKLIRYRRHGNNTSSGGFLSETTTLFKIQYRLYLLMHLAIRILKIN